MLICGLRCLYMGWGDSLEDGFLYMGCGVSIQDVALVYWMGC